MIKRDEFINFLTAKHLKVRIYTFVLKWTQKCHINEHKKRSQPASFFISLFLHPLLLPSPHRRLHKFSKQWMRAHWSRFELGMKLGTDKEWMIFQLNNFYQI